MGAKLVSGRVEKISSANVSADRYQFLSLSEAEPDLGLPLSDGQVLASNTAGSRYFVTLNTDNVPEANSLYYTNARVELYLNQNDVTVQTLTVQGNLFVQGNTTTLNTDTLTIEDKNIVLANGAINASVADGAGITIAGAQANIVYRESGDKFEINKNLEVTGNIIAGSGGGGSITGANLISANTIVVNNALSVNGYDVITKELTDATFEPMGHENKANSQISFDANTRTFSIQPVGSSYTVWVKGNKFVKTGTESVILANTTDLYYIYFNTSGNVAVRSSYFDWENDALTSYVYWNANTQSAVFFADERHGITLDWATHEYLHRTRGAVIAEGFSISDYTLNNDGSSDANAQISIGNGTFFDEDLQVDIVHSNTPAPNTWEQDLQGPARIPMFYLSGTEWVRDEPTDFPLKQGISRIKYNLLSGGQWSTPDVPVDGNFTTSWIIATNNLNYPILAIMGQSASDTIGQEEAKNFQDLTLTDFPVIEFRPLYKIIWNTNTGFANTPKAVISKVYDLRNIISASPSAAIASDHGLLSGLGDDDHDQYLHTEIARTVTASHTFGGTQTFANIVVNGTLSGNISGVSAQVQTLDNFTTSNLAEGDNLYYTNARVFSNVSNMSINVFADVYMENPEVNDILIWDGNGFVLTAIEQATAANIANVVLSLQLNTTDELSEGNVNLYYTNARVQSYLDENGYQTAANILANVSLIPDLSSNTTDDLNEGTNNLYYTNARVLTHLAESNVSAKSFTTTGVGTPSLISETSLILSANATNGGAVVIQSSPLRLKSYTTVDRGNITAANGDLIFNSTNQLLQIYSGNDWLSVGTIDLSGNTTTDLAEGNNLYYTNARVGSYLEENGYQTAANILANVVTSMDLSGNTTTDLNEGTNLYYTNARVNSYLTENGYQTAANILANVSAIPDLSTNTTTDLNEGTNLYYTNARVNSYLTENGYQTAANILANVITSIDLSGNTTTDLTEGDNLYYTNARVLAHLAVSNVEIKNLTVTSNLFFFGNALIITANTLKIEDPIIQVASNNEVSDNIDFGWVGHYSPDAGATRTHAGMIRKHGTDSIYIFSQYVDENLDSGNLVTNINLQDNTFRLSDVHGNVFYGKISTLENHTTSNLVEGTNLYYTNARVQAFVQNLTLAANLSASTTDDLIEGNVNLYYTNTRARSAFTAGPGITISPGGIIGATDVSESFNISIDGTVNYLVTSTLSNVVVFPSTVDPDTRYILRSLHLTNISEDTAYVSGNLVFNNNPVVFADKLPIPYGTSLEMLLRPQAFGQLDYIQLQGFDQTETPTSNLVSAVLVYESTLLKSGLAGTGNLMTVSGTEYEVLNSQDSFAIIESIRLVNLDDTSVRSKVVIADSNSNHLGYLAYNLALPAKTSVEVLQSAKRINIGEKVLTSLNSNANVSVILSYRKGGTATIGTYVAAPASGSNVSLEFDTNIPDGTTLYYTIE
jgi:hypothetical protein